MRQIELLQIDQLVQSFDSGDTIERQVESLQIYQFIQVFNLCNLEQK